MERVNVRALREQIGQHWALDIEINDAELAALLNVADAAQQVMMRRAFDWDSEECGQLFHALARLDFDMAVSDQSARRNTGGTTVSDCDSRSIDPDWPFTGDDGTPGRYISRLADALWRHAEAENWATLGALVWAAMAVGGDEEARADLDSNPAWDPHASPEEAA